MATIKNIDGYPFEKLSAEEEKNYLKDIFYKQQYYDPLLNTVEEGVSRFILGQRGQGKSATILHLLEDLKNRHILPILIDRYSGFPEKDNENYFLHEIIQSLTTKISEHINHNRKDFKKLSDKQKQQIRFFIEVLYDPICSRESISESESIKSKEKKNIYKKRFNKYVLGWLNSILSACVSCIKDSITKYGYDIDFTPVAKDYISGFEIDSFEKLSRNEIVLWDKNKLLDVIENLRNIAIKLGYKSIAIMFDKIDETDFMTDVTKIATFMHDILADTQLLYTEKIAIIVSIWSDVKQELINAGIRFDKFKEVDIRWKNEELEKLINKRLLHFSKDKDNAVSLDSLVPNTIEKNKILELADHSPRSLLNLLGCILYEEQQDPGIQIISFSEEALRKGYKTYCIKFDYTSAQSSRIGQNDLYNWINRLLQFRKINFTLDEYKDVFAKNQKTGKKHIETMTKFHLIKNASIPDEKGNPIYEIEDPRIRYLISIGEQSLS